MLNNALLRLPKLSLWQSLSVGAVMVLSTIFAYLVTPTFKELTNPPVLEKAVPLQVGDWQNKPSPFAQVSVNTFTKNLIDEVYDQVLMRNYQDKAGNKVMLALAFAAEQRQEIKVHQPEVCYPAQGYEQLAMNAHLFNISGYPLPIKGKQLIFRNQNRMEAVSYWIRIGNSFPLSGFEMRLAILKAGLKGNLTDGVLVRVSTIINEESEAPAAYKEQEKFLAALVLATNATAPNLLVPAQ